MTLIVDVAKVAHDMAGLAESAGDAAKIAETCVKYVETLKETWNTVEQLTKKKD